MQACSKILLFWLSFAAALSAGFVVGIISYFLIEIMLF